MRSLEKPLPSGRGVVTISRKAWHTLSKNGHRLSPADRNFQ
jgi:hypothetical protein